MPKNNDQITRSPFFLIMTNDALEKLLQDSMKDKTCYIRKHSSGDAGVTFVMKQGEKITKVLLRYLNNGNIQYNNTELPSLESLAKMLKSEGWRLLDKNGVNEVLSISAGNEVSVATSVYGQGQNHTHFTSPQPLPVRTISVELEHFYSPLSEDVNPVIKELANTDKTIKLSHLHLTLDTAKKIANAISCNKSLNEITLEAVHYETMEAAKILFEAIGKHSGLKSINCLVVYDEMETLFSELKSNTNITKVYLGSVFGKLENMYLSLCNMLQENSTLKEFSNNLTSPTQDQANENLDKIEELATHAQALLEYNQKMGKLTSPEKEKVAKEKNDYFINMVQGPKKEDAVGTMMRQLSFGH